MPDNADSRALADMERIKKDGVQVEWKDYESFFACMVASDHASVQERVTLNRHLCDTALFFFAIFGLCQRYFLFDTARYKGRN